MDKLSEAINQKLKSSMNKDKFCSYFSMLLNIAILISDLLFLSDLDIWL